MTLDLVFGSSLIPVRSKKKHLSFLSFHIFQCCEELQLWGPVKGWAPNNGVKFLVPPLPTDRLLITNENIGGLWKTKRWQSGAKVNITWALPLSTSRPPSLHEESCLNKIIWPEVDRCL